MLDNIGSIDFQEKKNKLLVRLKYVIFLLPIIPIIMLINYYVVTYGDVEDELIKIAKKYVKDNNIKVQTESYIPLGTMGEIEGAELCSNASGVIVTRSGNKYKYQAYLKCLDYETKLISNSEKYIVLSGDAVTILNAGEIYEEKGYYSDDIVEVETEGSVGTAPGIYTLNYKVIVDGKQKQTLTRKVIITEFDKSSTNSGVTSSDKPTLTLLGNTTMILEKSEKFVDPGYKAVDYHDGKISRKVKRIDNVDTKNISKKIGTYILEYSITNSKKVTVTKKRTVKVVDKKSDIIVESSIKKQTSGFVIVLNITGSGYSGTILPNSTALIKDTTIYYKVTHNGKYSFAIYDFYNNVIVREVDVNDVDISGPTGNCNAMVSLNSTNIYASVTDKSGIKSYNFIIDGTASGELKSPSFTSSKIAKEASVQVIDTYGNTSTLKCQISDVSNRGTMTNGIMNIPLILQTNYTKPIKWGNNQTTTVKGYGCGPTSVSMIIAYLTGNVEQNPQIIFEWLNSLGYFHGYGFGKAALTKAAAKYGVKCEWKKLDAASLKSTLLSGRPIIAFMGKGIFTSGGHYIVLKGVTADGKIAVNDPFSEKRSKKTYDAQTDIIAQTRTTTSFAVCY